MKYKLKNGLEVLKPILDFYMRIVLTLINQEERFPIYELSKKALNSNYIIASDVESLLIKKGLLQSPNNLNKNIKNFIISVFSDEQLDQSNIYKLIIDYNTISGEYYNDN